MLFLVINREIKNLFIIFIILSFFLPFSFSVSSEKRVKKIVERICKKKPKLEMDRSVFTPPHSPPSPPFNQSFTPSDKVEPLRDTSLPPKEDLSQLFKSDADALIRGEHKKLEPMAPPKTPEEIEKSRRIFEEYYLEISDLDHHINFKHKLGIIELSSHKKAHLILMDPFKSYAGIENEISFQLRETISSLHLNGRNYSIDFTDILEGSIVIEFHHWTWLRSNREEIKKFFVLFYNKLNDINI